MLTKKLAAITFVILVILGMTPFAMAMPDPFSTLLVWPYGTPEESEGPIIIGPADSADMIIFNKDNSHVLDDVWLLLAMNSIAYDHLISISTNTSLSFTKVPQHFVEIPGDADPEERIPPHTENPGTSPSAPYAYRPDGWPGVEPFDQYKVGSLRSQLDVPPGQSMYYSVGDLDNSTDWIDHGPIGLNRNDPEYFTLTVELDSEPEEEQGKVLILALGHSDDYPDDHILNVRSPFTRSTLMLSEVGAILLALAPLSAFALYIVSYRIRKKKAQ